MKNKFFLWLSLLITLSIVLYSCRNEELAKDEATTHRNNADFFKHSKANSTFARAGVDYISILEAYNDQTGFLAQMPDQRGMPIWDKMQVVDTETTTGLIIPLSYDNETMSSILFATLNDRDQVIGVRDFDNALLEGIVYDQKISVENRERLFLTFMHMDNLVFGNEEFIGIPKDLFIGKKSDDEYATMWVRNFGPYSSATAQQEGKIIIMETCFIVLHCTHHGVGSCDAVDGCTACGTTVCSYEVVVTAEDDPYPPMPNGGGGGGSGGGGGGSTTPGPNVPTNPCGSNLGTVFYRLAPGCGGGGTLPGIDDPCEKTNAMLNRPNVQQGINNVKANAKQTLTNPSTGEIGFKEKKDGSVIPADVNADHKVVYNNVTDGYGGYHNHTASGIHMVSPPDIVDTLFGFAAAQSAADGVGNAYYGMIAAESCSTCPDGVKYVHYVIRFAGTGTELGGFVFSSTQMKQFIDDYMEAKSDLTSTIVNGSTYINSSGGLNEKGLEKLFFDTLKNMGLSGKVNLQRVEDNGAVYNIVQDSAGNITAVPCL